MGTLSALYFKTHPEGEDFVNPNMYIPQEMVYQPPKKTGVSLFVQRKPIKASKNENDEPMEDAAAEESNEAESSEEIVQAETRKRTGRAASNESEEANDAGPPDAKKSENGNEV